MSPLLIYNNESRTPKKSQKLLSYKFWIALLSVNYVFIDFIRRFFEGNKNLLILLDLNMPKKNGMEVLDEIKSDEYLRKIPVVILTTSSAEEDVLKTYNLHANCYITKPIDLLQFQKVVKSIEDFWLSIVILPPDGRAK